MSWDFIAVCFLIVVEVPTIAYNCSYSIPWNFSSPIDNYTMTPCLNIIDGFGKQFRNFWVTNAFRTLSDHFTCIFVDFNVTGVCIVGSTRC